MTTTTDFRFPVTVHWHGGRLTRTSAFDKPDLRVANPREFRGGVPDVWSPEDLLVAATSSSFTITFAAVAEQLEIPLIALDVNGTGH
jgi:organic hydroperoxide reductase OsmC/OhrA